MALSKQKPAMDTELRASLENTSFPPITHVNDEIVRMMRSVTATPSNYIDELKAKGVAHREIKIPSLDDDGEYEIVLSVLQPVTAKTRPRPCLYWMHGGGFHWGDRLHTLEFPVDVVRQCDAVCVSVEYRLAPEYSFAIAVEDCYAGLKWVGEHVQELGIDAKRLMIGGTSAGGALAASTALLCRDRHGPVVCAQCLVCPALDDRLDTVSSQQYVEGSDFMPSTVMKDIWKSSLKGHHEGSDGGVTVPGRAKDLSGLPTTYLDVGSAEVLRDETVAYASKLWANGVQAELHVWAGGFHGYDIFLPDAAVSQASRKTKVEWVKRIFEIDVRS